jgi:N-ethylmaleimide reductase
MSSKLFTPTKLGNLTLQNHFVMAPLTRSRAIGNIPNELMATYYGQRATAGLIITEGTSPSPNGLGYSRIPGIFSQAQIEGWKLITQAVHEKGGKIFIQLMHTGRITHPLNLPEGAETLAPSAVKAAGQMWTDQQQMLDHPEPKAMSLKEVQNTIEEYVQASKNAIEAGFDGVELHGANGYLMEQFIHPHTNQRTDEYGGSIEKRAKFVLEVAQKIADAIGKDKVGIRLSPYGVFNDLPLYDEIDATYTYLAQQLNQLDIAYIHLVNHEPMGAAHVSETVVKAIRENFKNTLILSGGYDKTRAEKDLASGLANLIAFGRPFLANPDLIERFKINAPLNEPKYDLFYTPEATGYTDYPTLA